MSHFDDVKSFHQKFGLLVSEQPTHLTRRKLRERVECLQEELEEFMLAVDSQSLPEQADALIDLVYFALGTAVMMGLPWDELWADVQRANMSKVRGETKRGHKVDVTKPVGWVAPQGHGILARHGYQGYDGEEYCLDDAL